MGRPQLFGEEKKRRFIAKLEELGSIKAAAVAVRVGTGSVDWARKRDGQFAAEVERVLEIWRGRPPVPMARADGFTAKKRRRCIKTLAKTGCITDAARVAGVSRKTVNDWRAKDPDFNRLCAAAIEKAGSHIETLAWERGVTGIEEPVIHYGKQVGTRIKRSDSIFRLLLTASNREKYGGAAAGKGIGGGSSSGRNEMRHPECFCGLDAETLEARKAETAERIAGRLAKLQQRKVDEQGYVRTPDGSIALPGWGPVTEEARQLAALPAEVWTLANKRGVLPRPDGTVPDASNATGCVD